MTIEQLQLILLIANVGAWSWVSGLIIMSRPLSKLQKTGRLETKKGTYTFTPKEKTTNE